MARPSMRAPRERGARRPVRGPSEQPLGPDRSGASGRGGRRPGPSAVRLSAGAAGLSAAVAAGGSGRRHEGRLLGRLAGGFRLFLHRLLVGGRGLPGQSGPGLDGALCGQPAAGGHGAVLGPGDHGLSPAQSGRRAARPAVRGPVRPSGMDARPCADRLSVEPGGRELGGRIGHVAVRLDRRGLWAGADHGGGGQRLGAPDRRRAATTAPDRGGAGRVDPGRPVRLRRCAPVLGAGGGDPDPGAPGPGRHRPRLQVEPGGLSRHPGPVSGVDRSARRRPARRDRPDPAGGPEPGRAGPERRDRRPLLQQPVRPARRRRRGGAAHRPHLRQAPAGAVRRIPADGRTDEQDRRTQPGSRPRRFHRRTDARTDQPGQRPAGAAADLLRGPLSGLYAGDGGDASGLDRQRLQRRLVRQDVRSAPASEPGVLSRAGDRPAGGAGHADGRFGHDRS
uniref:LigA n=1 Tax=Parastrongyloides trichosuri TaxID=131310 RepID=A0A0N5A6E9_PARTI